MDVQQALTPGLEQHNLAQKVLRLIIVPVLNYLVPAEKLKAAISRVSDVGDEAVRRAGSTHAMESFYSGAKKSPGLGIRLREYFSHELVSATKATRNRLRVVEEALESELAKLSATDRPVSVWAFGGGTCRSLMNVFTRLRSAGKLPKVHVTSVDLDATAHAAGRALAGQYGYSQSWAWREGNVLDAALLADPESVDIVEMIGLLEYLDDHEATLALTHALQILRPGGLLVAANVRPTSEARFYRKIGWPKMYYRTPKELGALLRDAGFADEATTILVEPVRLHNIVLVRNG